MRESNQSIKPLTSSQFLTFGLIQTPLPAPAWLPCFLLLVVLSPSPSPLVRIRKVKCLVVSFCCSLLIFLCFFFLASQYSCPTEVTYSPSDLALPAVGAPQLQSHRGVPALMWVAHNCLGTRTWNLSCPEHISSHKSPLQVSQTISWCVSCPCRLMLFLICMFKQRHSTLL